MITAVAAVVIIAGVLMARQEKARQRDVQMAQADAGALPNHIPRGSGEAAAS